MTETNNSLGLIAFILAVGLTWIALEVRAVRDAIKSKRSPMIVNKGVVELHGGASVEVVSK